MVKKKKRFDGRKVNQIRKFKITTDYQRDPYGSVLIECGNTKVICSAFLEEGVPRFLKGQNQGWLSAEYSMLPGASSRRIQREVGKGKQSGRTMEIQRLIGRALRAVTDLNLLGENTIWIDCDVIQADGGTRTASITGSFVALMIAFYRMKKEGLIKKIPAKNYLAAISVGVVDGTSLLDLCYEEDVEAEVDMNVVMTDKNDFVEIQGTGEESTFSYSQMEEMLKLAKIGIKNLITEQKKVLKKYKN